MEYNGNDFPSQGASYEELYESSSKEINVFIAILNYDQIDTDVTEKSKIPMQGTIRI